MVKSTLRAVKRFIAPRLTSIRQRPILVNINNPLPEWLLTAAPWLPETRALMGDEAYKNMIGMVLKKKANRNEAMRQAAWFLCHAGLQDHGIALYKTLLDSFSPNEMPPESYYLPYMQFMLFASPEIQTDEVIYNAHTYWGNRIYKTDRIYNDYPNTLEPRRLRIGYVCHFVTNSTSSTLLLPLLKSHNRDRVEIFMYSDETNQKPGDKVRNVCEHWRDTYGISDDKFCDLVRQDQIDILLELNGPIAGNRYHATARHPAPIQVAWYNYTGTTGAPGLDYTLTGDDIVIEKLQPYYSETIIRKPGTSFAAPVGDYFPPITPAPFEKNGYITFGSFGQVHKLRREQVLLWCEVLKRVPNSKMFMKSDMLTKSPRAAWIHHFKSGGIDESRLIFEGNSDYATLLKTYAHIDIALDTYPYNAGTTTVEATMQGVPVVSQTGPRYCAQAARAIVGAGGHPELQGQSSEEFVDIAVALANAPDKLRKYRECLRKDYMASPRNDMKGWIVELEDTYAEMWRRYVAGEHIRK